MNLMLRFNTHLLLGGVLALAIGCDDDPPTKPPVLRDPRNIRVVYDGTGDYPTIQAAINASINGDTVSLANGRFVGGGNRDLDLKGRRILVRSESGDPSLCIIDCVGNDVEPHRGFLFSSGETNQTRIEGVTVENGYGVGGGGAITCEKGSSPAFRSVVFRLHGNVAVDCKSSSPSFNACTFALNVGGAIRASQQASPVLGSCTFVDNYSSASGAAIVNLSSRVTMTDCRFIRNGASFSGGAIYSTSLVAEPARLAAMGCVFLDNVAGSHGGAIDVVNSEFSLESCTFARNACGQNGGAIWAYAASVGTISSSVFYGNSASKGSSINCGASSSTSFERTIMASNLGSMPVYCDSILGPPAVTIVCSDVYGNEIGDWTGCIASQSGTMGNLSLDPLFCNAASDDFYLQSNSPCLPPVSACGPMGIAGDCGAFGAAFRQPVERLKPR